VLKYGLISLYWCKVGNWYVVLCSITDFSFSGCGTLNVNTLHLDLYAALYVYYGTMLYHVVKLPLNAGTAPGAPPCLGAASFNSTITNLETYGWDSKITNHQPVKATISSLRKEDGSVTKSVSESAEPATLKRTGPQGCTGPYRALMCSVIGRWAGFIWSGVINIDYRIPDDDTEA